MPVQRIVVTVYTWWIFYDIMVTKCLQRIKKRGILIMKATILLINFKDQQKLRKLKMALLPFKIRLKTVEPQDYCQPVGYLAGIKEISRAEIPAALIPQEQMEKEMLVIAGITGNLFDQILFTLRKAGTPVDYKAVLTEHNRNWNCLQLYKELEKEHRLYH